MKKKLFTIALSAIMVIAMAVPAFAATWTSNSNIYSGASYLNLYGSQDYAYKNRNVTVYSRTNSLDQVWYITNLGHGQKIYTAQRSLDGNRYTLNMNTANYNCNIYMDLPTNNTDSVVTIDGDISEFSIDLQYRPGSGLAAYGSDVSWGGVYTTLWTKN